MVLPALPGPWAPDDTPNAQELNDVVSNVAYAVNKPGLLARRTTAQTGITTGANIAIGWQVADDDTLVMLNPSDLTQVICQRNGRYLCAIQVPFTVNATGSRWVFLTKNTVTVANSFLFASTSGPAQAVHGTIEERFAVGDILRAWVLQDSGSTLSLVTSFGGVRMSVRWQAP